MYSRAHLIIKSELLEASKENGIKIQELKEGNAFELVALLEGLPETIWEGGVFQIYMKFDENYNSTPPQVFFQTIPFHPNIDINTGKPSLDFLDESVRWRSQYTIKKTLRSLQNLLAYPFLDRAINMDAVFLLKDNPVEYESVVKQSILATKRIRHFLKQPTATKKDSAAFVSSKEIESDLTVNLSSKISCDSDNLTRFPLFKINNSNTDNKNQKSQDKAYADDESQYKLVKNISYDDYSKLWFGIATTKSVKDEQNIYLNENLINNPNLLAQHISISLNDLEEQVYRQLTEHRNIMYGKFKFKGATKTSGRANSAKKGKPLPKSQAVNYNDLNNKSKIPNSSLDATAKVKATSDDEHFEEQVNDLINWTKNI